MDKLISRNFHNVPISLIRFTEKFLKLVDCVKCVLFLSVSEIISFWFKETKLWFLLLFFKFKFISTTIVHMAPFSKCIFKSRIFFQFFFLVCNQERKNSNFFVKMARLLIAISLLFYRKKCFFLLSRKKHFLRFSFIFFSKKHQQFSILTFFVSF